MFGSRGQRKFGDVAEDIESQSERDQVRWQVKRVVIKAFFLAVPFTLVAYWLPL